MDDVIVAWQVSMEGEAYFCHSSAQASSQYI